jgi:prephenate dehydrogenase
MLQLDTVAIVGVGLIGASVGLALRRRGLVRRVVGIGRREATLRAAREVGAASETTLDLAAGVAAAELIVVCTPVGRIAADVRAAAAACPAGALVTDTGSTKAAIVAALEGSLPRGVRFVGSHPLAGSHRSGPAAASADLFQGKLVLITPAAGTPPRDVQQTGAFWEAIGSNVETLSPEEHDRALAATSHLPHLAAAALAAATPQELLRYVATGWLDSTRVAAGDAELWTQIFAANRGHVLAALSRLEGQLRAYRTALEAGDDAAVRRLWETAKEIRERAKPPP